MRLTASMIIPSLWNITPATQQGMSSRPSTNTSEFWKNFYCMLFYGYLIDTSALVYGCGLVGNRWQVIIYTNADTKDDPLYLWNIRPVRVIHHGAITWALCLISLATWLFVHYLMWLTKKIKTLHYWAFVRRNHHWWFSSQRPAFPCYEVNMQYSDNPHLNIKSIFPKYGDSHVKDKTAMWPSYL